MAFLNALRLSDLSASFANCADDFCLPDFYFVGMPQLPTTSKSKGTKGTSKSVATCAADNARARLKGRRYVG